MAVGGTYLLGCASPAQAGAAAGAVPMRGKEERWLSNGSFTRHSFTDGVVKYPERAGTTRGVGAGGAKGGALGLEEIDLIDGRNFVAGVPHHWFAELRREAPVFWHPEEARRGAASGPSPATTTASPSTGTGSTSPRPGAAPSSTRWTTISWPSSS